MTEIAKLLNISHELVTEILKPDKDSLELYNKIVNVHMLKCQEPEEMVFYDIGTRDLSETLKLCKLHPKNRFVAFEAHPKSFYECIHKSMGYDKIQLVNCAATNYNGEAEFYLVEGNDAASSLLEPIDIPYSFKAYSKIKVKAIKLATFIEESKLQPDFIWIDIQGSELDALNGLGKEYLENVKVIHLEAARTGYYKGHAAQEDIHSYLCSHGFDIYEVVEHKCHPYGECDYIYTK